MNKKKFRVYVMLMSLVLLFVHSFSVPQNVAEAAMEPGTLVGQVSVGREGDLAALQNVLDVSLGGSEPSPEDFCCYAYLKFYAPPSMDYSNAVLRLNISEDPVYNTIINPGGSLTMEIRVGGNDNWVTDQIINSHPDIKPNSASIFKTFNHGVSGPVEINIGSLFTQENIGDDDYITLVLTPQVSSFTPDEYLTFIAGNLNTNTGPVQLTGISPGDTIPPTVSNPAISSSNITSTTASLNWNAASDNVTQAANLEYQLYQSTSNNLDTVQNIETNGTSIGNSEANKLSASLTGLTPNTTYYYNVIVKDAAGNKSIYQAVSFTTKKTWSVTYNGNNADSGSLPVSATVEDGASVLVSGNTGNLAKAGHTFSGWTLNQDGSGTVYQNADQITNIQQNITLYAKWTPLATYSVTYDGNGSTSGSVPADSGAYNQDATVIVATKGSMDKAGYEFTGWNTAANGSGTAYAAGQTFPMPNTDVSLYAQWELIPTYTITYNGNGNEGGTVPAPSSPFPEGESVTLATEGDLQKSGHSFMGWNTASNGSGTDYSSGQTIQMPPANVTLYAIWKSSNADLMDITVNNMHVDDFTADTLSYNQSVVNTVDSAVIDVLLADQDATVTINGQAGNQQTVPLNVGLNTISIVVTAPDLTVKTYTVVIERLSPLYEISYSDNGAVDGSVPASVQNYAGQTVTVSGNTGSLVKTGHDFKGWNTQADGLGTTYEPGDTLIVPNGNLTLYAKWEIKKHTVTFNTNGGTGPVSQIVNDGGVLHGDLTVIKAGHTFAGWYTDQAFTQSFDPGTAIYADTDLYAKWDINTYSVTYVSNEGTFVPAETVDYDQTFSEPTSPVKAGHTFVGWYTDEELTTEYDFDTKVSSNLTLYAKWSINTYVVTYVSNDGTSVTPETVEYDQTYTEPESPVKAGHTFVGWYTDEQLTMEYDFDTEVSSDLTLYAKWMINEYQIIFDFNYDDLTETVTKEYHSILESPDDPLRADYIFGNWFTDQTFETLFDFPTQVTGDLTLYARWDYLVEFDTRVDPEDVQSQSVIPGGKVTKPAHPVRTGHTFVDWYVNENDSEPFDFDEVLTGSVRLIAKWTPNEYQVTFDSKGGSDVLPVNVLFEHTLTQPANPTRSGYQFGGWYTNDTLTSLYAFTTPVTQNLTLYAKWNQNSAPVPGPSPNPEPTPDPSVEEIVVDVTDGSTGGTIVQTPIKRSTNTDGTKSDDVLLTPEKVKEFAEASTNKIARIVIPDANDEVIETNISIPKDSLDNLTQDDISVQIDMNDVTIDIPVSSLSGFTDDLYFRVVPVKEENGKNEIEDRAKQEEMVKETAGAGATIKVLGRPMTIETNLQSRPVTLTLPLPQGISNGQLQSLAVFIEHSDGTKEVIKGAVIDLPDGQKSVQFEVNKFSTFTLLTLELADVPDEGEEPTEPEKPASNPYIKGFEDGTFRPEAAITRQQMAAMLARQLTQSNVPAANVSPFSDLKRAWAVNEIEYVRGAGIMTGHTASEFRPHHSITRAQMAAIATRWIDQKCSGSNTYSLCEASTETYQFTDVPKDHWASEMIEQISQLGIMTGYENGTFQPNAPLTRAQAVKVLNRIFERLPEEGKERKFSDVPEWHWAFDEIMEAAN
ncbi:InlB B-repeat-containing protein [Jeotgalibacillus aurantiacus]|uniref:InlB B-repeat-containing protein n=1 Tax=Jeotgalibacillus aurantiacus TaxID=2763266 RepID=UPI001D0BC169|nr:InlB B-repeat-containing protein [Jeotgalibacillus aurantiacus]